MALFELIAAALLAAPPTEQRVDRYPPPGDCDDDDGVDRCDAEQQRRVRELFGVKSIEEHRNAGDTVRRAFFVDGYGRDLVAVSFVRAKGRDPVLWVHAPKTAEGEQPAPLTAAVPASVWNDLIRRSGHFDKPLHGPEPRRKRGVKGQPQEDQEIILCIHSWVYTVESADISKDVEKPGTVRRKTEDACDDGLAEAYASELAKAAVPLLPPCALLDSSQHRNDASLLRACTGLTGDRLAAAEVMNALRPFFDISKSEEFALLEGFFRYDVKLDWQGAAVQPESDAARFWAAKVAEGEGSNLYYETIEGLTADRVRMVGFFSRSIPGKPKYEQARVEQVWAREGSEFAIERATVGPWQELP